MTNTKSNEESTEVTLEPQLDLSPAPRKEKQLAERRPYKFTPQNKKKVLTALQLGSVPDIAAAYVGIDKRTLMSWIRRGIEAGPDSEGLDREFYEFAELCTQARANAAVGLTAIAWRHAREDGKVTIALMEKLFPETYGRKSTTEVKGKVEHEHRAVDYSKLSDEELEEAERLALKARNDQEDVVDAEILE